MPRQALRSTALLAAAALLVSGCGSVGVPQWSAPQLQDRTVWVDASRSGKQVDLRLDQELVVRLPTETAKGYRWMRDSPNDGAVLASVGRPGFEREGLDTNAFENAGFETFRFKPKTAGQESLRFEYRRIGFVNPEPADTAWFLVAVR